MVIVCDTSFLFTLYGNDAHSARPVVWVATNTRPTFDANQRQLAEAEGLIVPL